MRGIHNSIILSSKGQSANSLQLQMSVNVLHLVVIHLQSFLVSFMAFIPSFIQFVPLVPNPSSSIILTLESRKSFIILRCLRPQ